MKFEDDNFEEEFLDWLNSKTKEEIIEGLKGVTMEIEIGDFVRTKSEIIGKVEQIENSLFWLEDGSSYSLSDKTIKHSKNIIDLIEVGDIVNDYKVTDFDLDYFNGNDRREEPKKLAVIFDRFCKNHIKEDKIETILTKEQYEKNCYKIDKN